MLGAVNDLSAAVPEGKLSPVRQFSGSHRYQLLLLPAAAVAVGRESIVSSRPSLQLTVLGLSRRSRAIPYQLVANVNDDEIKFVKAPLK